MTPILLLLLQMAVILAATALCARAARRLGQPAVIGEIVGGILLGPSVLGLLWPQALAFLFPAASLAPLRLLSQAGLVVFMFFVGLGVDLDALKKEARTAVLISNVSVILPFLLGAGLALPLFARYAFPGVPFSAFALFMGIAMSITAFPVLARILDEKGLTSTPLGAIALSCAAVDDLTAWCALAVVIAVARNGALLPALGVSLACVLYVAFMGLCVRPALSRIGRGAAAPWMALLALATAALSALATERIGVHALFGAFLAGVVMPDQKSVHQALSGTIAGASTRLLLPLFFALTGLRTQVGLLDSPRSWAVCGLVVAVAVAGKLGGSAAAARWSGLPWRRSLALGVLMNTRGLVELVVLNIGYELGVIPPSLFTMLVLMALVTTLMTGPLLDALSRGEPSPQ